MISIGMVLGGGELAESPINQALSEVSKFFSGKEQGDFGSLNVIFYVPGSISKPTFSGMRTGRFCRKKKLLMIQVEVPEEVKARGQKHKFILESLRGAVQIAVPVFEKARIEYPVEAYAALISRAESIFGPPQGR